MKNSWFRLIGGLSLVSLAILLSVSGCSANSAPGEQLVGRTPDASVALSGIRMSAIGDINQAGDQIDVVISVARYSDPSMELAHVKASVPIGTTKEVTTGKNAGSNTFTISTQRNGNDVVVTIHSRIMDNGRVYQPSVRFLAKQVSA